MRFLQRANRRPGLLRLIKIIVDVHRLFGGPDFADGIEEGVGARIALVVVEIIAVTALLGIIATADNMYRQPAAKQMFKSGKFTRGESWRDKTGAVRQQESYLLRRQPASAVTKKPSG